MSASFSYTDYEMRLRRSPFMKIFSVERFDVVRKAQPVRRTDEPDRATVVRWLQRNGRPLLDKLADFDIDINEAADLLMQCAQHGTAEKCEVSNMDHPIIKALHGMTEAQYTDLVTKYARSVFPELPAASAFAKVFTEDSPQGHALRVAHGICKGTIAAADDIDDDADDESDESDTNTEADADRSSLEMLEALAAKLRSAHPEWSREKCFTKVYTDPANVDLAKAERKQNRPRVG